MDISIDKAVAERLGVKALEPFGYTEDKLKWKSDYDLDLANLTKAQCRKFRDLLAGVADLPKVKARIADVDRWLAILDGTAVKCKKLKDFAPMLKQFLKDAPKHWIYYRDSRTERSQPYYVSNIHYTPPKRDRYNGYVPGYVTASVSWEEMGQYHSSTITFHAEDVEYMAVEQALAEKNYQIETPELLAVYKTNAAYYARIYNKVGLQVLATGTAVQDGDDDDRGWWRRSASIKLDRDGDPARLVIDVFREDDKAEKSRGTGPSAEFWRREGCDFDGSEEDDDKVVSPGDEDDDDPAEFEQPDVPLLPSVKCFDLRRHVRVTVTVDQLSDYEYQTDLGKKLILPGEITKLVDLLVSHKGGFKDIVGGKSGGCVILCAGLPGTGKTLTSEVYSESMSKPLYSVQCSQLGTDPDDLEKELLKVFARAQRWGAILLLDEADVYVSARGRDLLQNAIVGVFLRTLEYYGGVLFLTTNRADLVDDAVASRCLARIDYKVPDRDDQARIWKTLLGTSGLVIADAQIDLITEKFPGMSGRDVKNLLKLAGMVAASTGETITAETVAYVRQFKPTTDGNKFQGD